jgi:hypothetical protein
VLRSTSTTSTTSTNAKGKWLARTRCFENAKCCFKCADCHFTQGAHLTRSGFRIPQPNFTTSKKGCSSAAFDHSFAS